MKNWKIGSTLAAAVLALAAFAPRGAVQASPPPVVHDVRMVLDGNVAKYEPAVLTIHPGDRVRFINVSGMPHNVSFDPATLPGDVQRALNAGMPDQIQPLWGPLMADVGATYTISFAGVKPGRYGYFCVPHMYDKNGNMTMGMKGTIVVQ
ncbi:MAG TPA: plastocyanin/azurin family copper-binding protein [Longimicrobiaceae bacterium]